MNSYIPIKNRETRAWYSCHNPISISLLIRSGSSPQLFFYTIELSTSYIFIHSYFHFHPKTCSCTAYKPSLSLPMQPQELEQLNLAMAMTTTSSPYCINMQTLVTNRHRRIRSVICKLNHGKKILF